MGLAFYVHGLFSTQMLSWIGMLLIAVGLGCVALNLPFPVMEWLAVFVLGLGLPLLGLALRYDRVHATVPRRLALSCAWLVVVIGLTVLATAVAKRPIDPHAAFVLLNEFVQSAVAVSTGTQVVRLPAGTVVPLNIAVAGDVLEGENVAVLPLKLAQDVDVVIRDGKLDGHFRVQNNEWRKFLYNYRIREFAMSSTLSPSSGPEASVRVRISTDN